MKSGKWILLGIVIIVLIGAMVFYNSKQEANLEDNENTSEIKETENQDEDMDYEASSEEVLIKAMSFKGNIDISKIMEHMDKADFNKIEDLYGENSIIEFLEWLSKQDISKKEDILILINSIENFYGREYFTYIESLSNTYIDYKFEFIRALALASEKLEDIGYALNYIKVYDIEGQDMWMDLDKIANSKELSEDERKIGMDLIYFYSECST